MSIPVRGDSIGDPHEAVAIALQFGAKRPDYLASYAVALWADAAQLGLRADVLWAQADLETGHFTSRRYIEEGNTAGMGIIDDKPASSPGHVFGPDEMARAQVTHMAGYVGIRPPDDWVRVDFRWAALMQAGFFGSVQTTADLGGGRWATDPAYGTKIEQRHALYFPREVPRMNVEFVRRIATSRLAAHRAKLVNHHAWFTIHENGNPRSGPFDEAAFVQNGGGREGVLYHFAVGVYNGRPTIVQIFPADRRGIHAGNATGNATAIAVETCQAPPGPLSDMTQAALRELVYMVVTGDPRIDWGGGGYDFALERVNMHANWRGANPNCPEYMLRHWGGIGPVISSVRSRLAAEPAPEPEEIGVGDTVATIVALNVRAEPGTRAAIIDTLQPGVEMIVTGEAVVASGYTWVPVRLGDGRSGWCATGGADGAYLTVVARAPEDGGPIVGGLPLRLAETLFGAYETERMRYAFNPEGVVSQAWLAYGAEEDRYPALAQVQEDIEGHKVFQFADGLVLTAPVDRPAEIERLVTAG